MTSTHVTIKLYGTKFCHLCEQAQAILAKGQVDAIIVDIADNDDWANIYGMRIPVLKRLDNHAELDWPFDLAKVLRFAAK